jgi:two-component system, sensor histidine kinase and response regulator
VDQPTPSKVLIVDDDFMLRQLLLLQLDKLGISADAATNGQEAIACASNCRYSLILMDIQMPVMDGYQATREIRMHENRNGWDSVPIVAITAGAAQADVIAQGMSDYLRKPVSVQTLENVLSRWLGRKQEAEQEG